MSALAKAGTASGYTATQNAENVNYTYTYDGYLSTITTDSTTYTLSYDIFGNSSSVKIGDRTLAEYIYNDYNGKLEKIIYGTGFSEEYVYNGLERLSEVWYNYSTSREKAFEYTYYSNGLIYSIDNLLDGTSTVYKYDNSERIIAVLQYDTEAMEYLDEHYVSYDSDGRVFSETYRIKTAIADTLSDGYTTHYSYNDDGSIWKEYSSTDDMRIDTEYTYDDLNRLSDVYRYSPSGFEYEEHYTYVSNGTSTSPLVSTYCVYVTNGDIWYGHEDEYFYDENGNLSIAAFERQTEYPVVYMYDDLSQLTLVEDFYNTIVYSYTYDNAGNIIKAEYGSLDGHTTNVYSYTDIRSGDILTAFNGVPITYDAIGNPLSYYNGSSYTFTWEGRRLVGAVSGGKTYSFTYNDEGIRTSKTVNGVEHKYYLSGSIIMAEEWGENLLVFVYDSTGSPIGMMYRTESYEQGTWDKYWFEKNMWGDITAIYDDAGNLILEYKYDPWGNCTEERLMNSYGAQYNPFRYRGYYYDADLGLYYLNSRYYDSNTCRFISPDGYVSTGQGLIGYNMYAYCNNNPVNYVDYSGEFSISIGMALCATGYALLATSLILLAYDVTHDQILGNMFADIVEDVAQTIESATSDKNSDDVTGYTVYALRDPTTEKIEYVGRTKNVEAREKAHSSSVTRGHLEFVILQDNLTKAEARGLEQNYMLYYHTINTTTKVNNQINGISLKNPNISIYVKSAMDYLGNQISNEFLNWIGR